MKSIEELLKSEGIIPERPPSLDEKGHRIDIFPAKVRGAFRKYRNVFYYFLLFVFLVLPWTTYKGQQTVLLHLATRKFVFFGQTLFAHDGPMIFFVLGTVVFSLALATALFGRIWCGWACPQTVFIDTLYRKVEEWIDGNHIQRKKLYKAPWTKEKIFKRGLKWAVFILISYHIIHSFMAYFVGARDLLNITLHSPSEHWGLFIAVQILTLLTVLNFGWFREQFCMIACPYGRFQSVLMDEKSLSVFYDYNRGEPRRQKGVKDYSDCVNCFKCVSVCPTGIDIRDGLQLECIACTACIDACDEVMLKLGKPKGLIRYASEDEIQSNTKKGLKIGFRSIFYAIMLFGFLTALTVTLMKRSDISVKAIRAVEAPYQVNGDLLTNHFRLHITNQASGLIKVESLEVDSDKVEAIAPTIKSELTSRKDVWVHVFLKMPLSEFSGTKFNIPWILKYSVGKEAKTIQGEFMMMGPAKKREM